jgi:hypothetical protein
MESWFLWPLFNVSSKLHYLCSHVMNFGEGKKGPKRTHMTEILTALLHSFIGR